MFPSLAHHAQRVRFRLAPTFLTIAALAVVAGSSPRMAASSIFFSGNLKTDATVTDCQGDPCTLPDDGSYATFAAVVDSFNVTSASTMTAITYGYGGGTNAGGQTVDPGGLEPLLSLFDGKGSYMASTYLGTTCPAGANIYEGNCFDVSLDGGTLPAGTYFIALTAYANRAVADQNNGGNLSDGFTGLGSLQGTENLNYAFDVILTPNSVSPPPPTVPEPNYVLLMGIAVAAPFFLKRMKLRAETHA